MVTSRVGTEQVNLNVPRARTVPRRVTALTTLPAPAATTVRIEKIATSAQVVSSARSVVTRGLVTSGPAMTNAAKDATIRATNNATIGPHVTTVHVEMMTLVAMMIPAATVVPHGRNRPVRRVTEVLALVANARVVDAQAVDPGRAAAHPVAAKAKTLQPRATTRKILSKSATKAQASARRRTPRTPLASWESVGR